MSTVIVNIHDSASKRALPRSLSKALIACVALIILSEGQTPAPKLIAALTDRSAARSLIIESLLVQPASDEQKAAPPPERLLPALRAAFSAGIISQATKERIALLSLDEQRTLLDLLIKSGILRDRLRNLNPLAFASKSARVV